MRWVGRLWRFGLLLVEAENLSCRISRKQSPPEISPSPFRVHDHGDRGISLHVMGRREGSAASLCVSCVVGALMEEMEDGMQVEEIW
jgi:hypothetical protein